MPPSVQRTIETRVTLAELITAAFKKTHLESTFGCTSIGQGLISNVFPDSMKAKSRDQRLSMTGSEPSFIRMRTRRKR